MGREAGLDAPVRLSILHGIPCMADSLHHLRSVELVL